MMIVAKVIEVFRAFMKPRGFLKYPKDPTLDILIPVDKNL
jgi:hypothetical protein